MNTKELSEYLHYIKMLEARLYELTRIYNRLSYKIKEYTNARYEDYCEEAKKERFDFDVCISIMVLGGIIGGIIGLIIGAGQEKGFFLIQILKCDTRYIFYGAIIGAIAGFIYMLYTYMSDLQEVKQYNKDAAIYNTRLAKKNDIMKKRNSEKIRICEQEQEVIKKQYNETSALLQEAYQLNILHPKYQNLIAVCSLCEYFETGRCSQLTGHEGGYNIFEMEKRLNLIVLKMDEIIEKLERVKDNQHMLYQTVSASNRNADRIYNQIAVISDQIGNIQQNQALIDYNTSICASNSEFLKWMEYFKR